MKKFEIGEINEIKIDFIKEINKYFVLIPIKLFLNFFFLFLFLCLIVTALAEICHVREHSHKCAKDGVSS